MSVHESALARMKIAAGAAEVVRHVEDLRELIGLAFVEAYGLGCRGADCGIDAWNRSGTRRVLRGWNTWVELAAALRMSPENNV